MKRMLSVLIVGGSALALCGMTLAAEPQRPGPGGPQGPAMMFQRLDADGDGRVVLDELPDSVPEFVKEMLKRADRDGDGVVTQDEFRAAMSAMGRRGEGAPMGPGRVGPPDRPSSEERARPDDQRRPASRPDAARRPDTGGPGPQARTRPSGIGDDPQVWFDRLDRDKDGKLSREEFAAGMRLFHRSVPSLGPGSAWGRGSRMQPPGPGPMWGYGPMMQPPWWGPAWGPAWRMQPRGMGPAWGRGPTMPGRADLGPRATSSPERRKELDQRIEQARQRAQAAWKRAAEMRDQAGEAPAAKKEAAERKKEPKKPADKPAAEGKPPKKKG
jgi:hypothetical protein